MCGTVFRRSCLREDYLTTLIMMLYGKLDTEAVRQVAGSEPLPVQEETNKCLLNHAEYGKIVGADP